MWALNIELMTVIVTDNLKAQITETMCSYGSCTPEDKVAQLENTIHILQEIVARVVLLAITHIHQV